MLLSIGNLEHLPDHLISQNVSRMRNANTQTVLVGIAYLLRNDANDRCYYYYSFWKYDIYNYRFEATITAQFMGHTHSEQFNMYYEDPDVCSIVSFFIQHYYHILIINLHIFSSLISFWVRVKPVREYE